jgi:hypothetical protein
MLETDYVTIEQNRITKELQLIPEKVTHFSLRINIKLILINVIIKLIA